MQVLLSLNEICISFNGQSFIPLHMMIMIEVLLSNHCVMMSDHFAFLHLRWPIFLQIITSLLLQVLSEILGGCDQGSTEHLNVQIQKFVQKLEILFIWSHVCLGQYTSKVSDTHTKNSTLILIVGIQYMCYHIICLFNIIKYIYGMCEYVYKINI